MNDPIYTLKLHEVYRVDELAVVRVPGGWIYLFDWSTTTAFVPYDDEFNESFVDFVPPINTIKHERIKLLREAKPG